MNKFYLFFPDSLFLPPLSASQMIRRTFSCYPGVDEPKHAIIQDIAQYVFLGLSDNQYIRNYIYDGINAMHKRCLGLFVSEKEKMKEKVVYQVI